jgi:hypothetical protein
VVVPLHSLEDSARSGKGRAVDVRRDRTARRHEPGSGDGMPPLRCHARRGERRGVSIVTTVVGVKGSIA